MGFGIQITGNDTAGDFIVQDTDLNIINYQVTATGTANYISSSSYSGNARLFINGNVGTTNTNKFITLDRTSDKFKTVTFSGNLGSNISGITYTDTNVNYLILKEMSAVSNSGGNYGIQLFTSAGAVAFDSRRIITNSSFFFTGDTKQSNAVAGDGGFISHDGDIYCDTGVLFEFAANSASAIRWKGTGVGVSEVEYLHFRAQAPGRGGGGANTSYIKNFGTIVTGKIR